MGIYISDQAPRIKVSDLYIKKKQKTKKYVTLAQICITSGWKCERGLRQIKGVSAFAPHGLGGHARLGM